ncbi:molybdopterin-guanine dinucleotide biosynthesis protein B [Psychromonas sp. Urea-02u-13]|uniref:molybdopterin-guanine dinucleotide biosynthesis protein B n=1 Tax=Psychromonas sp. Urea-02u-13 TaxID=2058326 RepID=UPI000C34D58C|nr:molybdopterin-guanine dinucleotide biosynthesis protein B [Psychromonas sp. Urea-02u-13]PKG38207.1 molybdopterin-guanine dinucleotide biosynthesis protein B [Psychromonas sp. Urea-02u-13]
MSELNNFPIPLLGFAAFSGTGKTTLLEKLIPLLCEQGLNIALVKHSHHNIELDKPGKDSYRLRKAGACQLLLAGTERAVIFHEYGDKQDKKLIEQLRLLDCEQLDLVLVEGYRDEAFNKIELHREACEKPFLFPTDASIIALACDVKQSSCALTQLDINSPAELQAFVMNYVKSSFKGE